jgi:phage gp29-like protein
MATYTIYDQFGRPYPKQESKPKRRPLASAPLTDAYREYVTDGLTPERLAAILKEADAGNLTRQAELFDLIEERDGHVLGDISKRRNVILDAEFDLEPASDDARDVKIAEECQKMLDGITDWPDVQVSLQDCVGKGFATFEQHWDVSEGQAWVEQFEFIEQKRFSFVDDQGLVTTIPRLITDTDPLGVEIPAWRVMMHRYGGKSGNPVRSGIYRICAWWFLFKNYSIKDWLLFCEIYGMPLRLGKYSTNASDDDKEALEIAVKTLGHDAAGVISKATEIEFVQAKGGSASSDIYKGIPDFANREMSKAILGGTLTTDVDGRGSYAAANTHNDVRHDLINADARAVAGTIRNQLLRPFVGFNYGWDTPVPKYKGRYKKEDLEAHGKNLDLFADRMDIPVSHVREKFHIPEPKKGEECLRPKTGQISTATPAKRVVVAKTPNVARNENLAVLDTILSRLEEEADQHIANLLGPVREIMAGSGSLNDLKENLDAAFPDMDSGALGKVIEKAMMVSDLAGRYEVSGE